MLNFNVQRFSPVDLKTAVTVKFRTTAGKESNKKLGYVNPSATDQEISDCVKALNGLTTNTYVTCVKTSEYDVEASIADDEEHEEP